MEIKLLLSKKEILQRVKAKSHFKGVADLAANSAKTTEAVRFTYNEQAGDDPNSDFLLLSSLRNNVDRFKTVVADYITTFDDYEVSANNISDTLSETTEDVFVINLVVSDRFNKALTQPLADSASAYIENNMIYEWYLPIDPGVAKNYYEAAAATELSIQRCFIKVRPTTPTYRYPDSITLVSPNPPQQGSDIPSLSIPIGQEQEITYSLTAEDKSFQPIDDIVISAGEPCVRCGIKRGKWIVRGMYTGSTIVTIFSRHDDQVKTQLRIKVV